MLLRMEDRLENFVFFFIISPAHVHEYANVMTTTTAIILTQHKGLSTPVPKQQSRKDTMKSSSSNGFENYKENYKAPPSVNFQSL